MNELQQAYGDWLRTIDWDWWVTLTFRYNVSGKQAHRAWADWIHSLESRTQGKVHYVRVTEIQKSRNALHFHALLRGVGEEQCQYWQHEWFKIGGLADIKKYDSEQKAAYYLAKNVTDDWSNIRLSKGFKEICKFRQYEK